MALYSTKGAAKKAGVSLSTLITYVRYGQIHPEKWVLGMSSLIPTSSR